MLTIDEVNSRLDSYMAKRRSALGRYTLSDLSKELHYSIQQISDVKRGRRSLTSDFAQRVKALTALKPEDHTALAIQQLEAIRDVVHFHIMSLAKLHDQRADPAWIAERLGISQDKASECLERLRSLGLVRVTDDGRFHQTSSHFTTGASATTALMGERYAQHSRLAFRAFYERPPATRTFTARTFALPGRHLAEANRLVRACLLELDRLETDDAEDVYTCFVQLFPVTGAGGPSVASVPSHDAPRATPDP